MGASGNLATEDLVHVLDAMGWETSATLEGVSQAGVHASRMLGKQLPGRYHRYYLGSCEEQSLQNVV